MEQVGSWILQGLCSNWATIDGLAGSVSSQLVLRYPDLLNQVMDWVNSGSLWLRRAALVSLVRPAREGRYLDHAYGLAERVFADREDLIQKAAGWLLREAGKTDMERLEHFLQRHGPKVPRTTLRYAIERFDAPDRNRLLEETRAT
jgi:3-methyladenine DNA glycosylase AlkD